MKKRSCSIIAILLCITLLTPYFSVYAKAADDNSSDVPAGAKTLSGDVEPESDAHGSGSYQLNETPDDYRFYTEYYVAAASNKSTSTAGIERRTTIKVYAKAGEVILFGSSVADSQIDKDNIFTGSETGDDIVITMPDGTTKQGFNVLKPGEDESHPLGHGYIANPTQEQYGPMVNTADKTDPDKKYYEPLKFEVPSDGGGVYTFEFHSVKGYNDGTVPTPKKANDPDWKQNTTTVAAWDVTVLGKKTGEPDKWEVKSGRAWADYLALTTGEAGTKTSDLDVHVLTHDGYIYNVKFKKAVPFGFIFFANNTGFMTTEMDGDNEFSRPIYHSFYDSSNDLLNMTSSENIHLHKPNEADTLTEETYKIFFNPPNPDLNEVTIDADGNKLKTDPGTAVSLENLKFNGIGDNIARANQGGHFTFDSSGEAMVTIRLDLRKAILDSESTMDAYEGSGIVEITAPAFKGHNSFYWDGKDTEGIYLPAGIYGNNDVILSSEVKRGELHFPVIDMEGLFDGLTVKRLNGDGSGVESADLYNLYYNNNPLVYGTIEGKGVNRVTKSGYDELSDGTKSYKITDKAGSKFFTGGDKTISTLVKDTKEYLALTLCGKSYADLTAEYKAIIDAEYGNEQDTYHFIPVNSNETSMTFTSLGNNGGGNQAGIDAWTYYSQGVTPSVISFALLGNGNSGMLKGQIFYDENIDSKYDTLDGDYVLPNVKVRLIDKDGNPLVHTESLPCFDDSGHFIYNEDGTVKHEDKEIDYEAVTDVNGFYRFTGVPYDDSTGGTEYYVQVMLTDVQSEVLRYTCTTSAKVKEEYKNDSDYFLKYEINSVIYGTDGNKIIDTTDASKVYKHKYERDDANETVFDKGNAQSVILSSSSPTEGVVHMAEFKKIGFGSTVPKDNLKNYKVTKEWGGSTHPISDGLIVELWVWNDGDVEEENTGDLSRRTGALVDTQVLNEANSWSYTWKDLDDRLQYYVLEYYTKKKPNGEIIYNDKHEPRKVLIGGTMPIYSAESSIPTTNKYGFDKYISDYPEVKYDSEGKPYIPIQKFKVDTLGDPNEHYNSITDKEKLESVDNNARQYNVTYTLSTDGTTNTITLKNSQVYDDKTYYVWLDHQTVLPDFIGKTYLNDEGKRDGHAIDLTTDKSLADGSYTIKGLSITSVDAADSENIEGNATEAFRIKEGGKSVLFTATNHGNYKTGTGTRTYQVKYVVDAGNTPVKVHVDASSGKLVDESENEVEKNGSYNVYYWYMTIHVYDVKPDGVIEYDPNNGPVVLQEALDRHTELTWTLDKISGHENAIIYRSDDQRSFGLLKNDTFRVPLYKAAENPDMGSCADLVSIAYAGNTPVDDISTLDFVDTYESRYGKSYSDSDGAPTGEGDGTPSGDDGGTLSGDEGDDPDDTPGIDGDGIAIAQGSGGYLTASLNPKRDTRINRVQDHVNYAEVTFTPGGMTRSAAGEDVFYYKIVVFAEDNTYQYSKYDEIDASEGVVMYTYFTMKPVQGAPSIKPNEGPGNDSSVIPTDDLVNDPLKNPTITPVDDHNDDPGMPVHKKSEDDLRSPKTGDNSNMFWWLRFVYFGSILMLYRCIRLYYYKKRK